MAQRDFKRQILLGGSTTAGIVVFLAIIVGVQYIVLQHPVRWDVTSTGVFTLASQSKKVLQTFKDKKVPIEVMAFYDTKSADIRDRVRDLLDQYRDVYPDFRYSFFDPDRDRVIALENKVDAHSPIVIKAAGRTEHVGVADEETITNALLRLLRSEVKKVYLLKGHGELAATSSEPDGFSIAKEQIEKQNYKVEELVLVTTNSVPQDATVLVIAGPQVDPMDEELSRIKDYLARGGSLFALLQPFKTPKLCALLKDYGFETAEDIVVDNMSQIFGGNHLTPVITTYIKFAITKNFTLASFFPESRSVQIAENLPPGIEAQDLAVTSQISWTITEENLKASKLNFDAETGVKGPLSVMGVATRTIPKEGTPPAVDRDKTGEDGPAEPDPAARKARVVVSGSSRFAENKFFKLSGNQDLFLNTISWLAEEENLIAIRPKSERARPLVLQANEIVVLLLIPVVMMPLAWIIAGVVVYAYRRRSMAA